jgi:hypothetical protein
VPIESVYGDFISCAARHFLLGATILLPYVVPSAFNELCNTLDASLELHWE